MTLESFKNEIVNWSYTDHKRFLENVSFNVSVGIRSILSEDINSENKLNSIRWFNEFIHNVNEQIFLLNHSDQSSSKSRILIIFENADFYSQRNRNTEFKILEIIKLSFNSAINHRNFKK